MADFNLSNLLGVITPLEFHQYLWRQKTSLKQAIVRCDFRDPWAILTELRHAGRTRGQTDTAPKHMTRYNIASCGNNHGSCFNINLLVYCYSPGGSCRLQTNNEVDYCVERLDSRIPIFDTRRRRRIRILDNEDGQWTDKWQTDGRQTVTLRFPLRGNSSRSRRFEPATVVNPS